MMPQENYQDTTTHEEPVAPYGGYEGDQEYASQHNETSYEQPLREGSGGKVYPPLGDNKNMLRLLWFVVAMVTLLAFAVICLVFVGGTAGWISFCAASLVILVIVGTAIDKIK